LSWDHPSGMPLNVAATEYDVVVIGGGNAALCAALAARSQSKRVLLLERAPEYIRGGNSRHTRDLRHSHAVSDAYVPGVYADDEFLDDLRKVSDHTSSAELAQFMVRESATLPPWMEAQGVRWQQPLRGTLNLSRTNRFYLGGGKALVNVYYRRLRATGVDVLYNALARDIVLERDVCVGVCIDVNDTAHTIRTRAVVFASGGFEANIEWLSKYWGSAAQNYVIRGSQYNDGIGLATLMRHGAKTIGNPKALHSVAVDARAPKFDGGIATRLDSVPFGIAVNCHGERFYDEGEDLWPKRYAIWGGLIAEQPEQIAYSIFDSKMDNRFMPSAWRPLSAPSITALAGQLAIPPQRLACTIDTFNRAVPAHGTFDPSTLDDCGTQSLTPPKSHWAVAIDSPPFYAFPLRPGITFTYMGVSVDRTARVRKDDGSRFENIFAAGEIMAGNILTRGYLAGTGMTIGTVFGRLAGREAARHAA
jgi:tricarballylate dehydrogenase